MAIATGAAIALAAGLGAQSATSIYAAKKQSDAGKEAAKIQTAATEKANELQLQLANRAIDVSNQTFGGIQQAYNPYLASSPASLSALHSYLGLPGASQSQTMVPYGAYGPPMRSALPGQPPMPPSGFTPAPGVTPSVPGTPTAASTVPAPSLADVYGRWNLRNRNQTPMGARG